MLKYTFKRLLAMIPVILGVIFIIQLIMYLSPADAAIIILGNDYTIEAGDILRHELGLDRPFIVQYLSYVWDLLHLDFGSSYISGQPVVAQLAARLPHTLILVFLSVGICAMISIPIGIRSAVKPDSFFSTFWSAFAMLGVAMPTFWLGLMLMLLFSVKLGWLPAIADISFKGLLMPVFTLAANFLAGNMRITRSSMLDCINQDYVRTARAKGVAEHDVIYKHALKNAALPIITSIGMNIGGQMGGASITETIFSYPGLGIMMINGINQKDTPTILACLVVLAISIGICNLAVDLIFALIDPRIKAMYKKGK